MDRKSDTINATSGTWSRGGRRYSSIFLFRTVTSWPAAAVPLFGRFVPSWQISVRHRRWQEASPVFCCYADHTQLSHAVSFVKWGWLLSCVKQWDCLSIIQCSLCFQNILFQTHFHAFNAALCYFVFSLLVFHKLMQYLSVDDLTSNYHMRSKPTQLVTTVFCNQKVRTDCVRLRSQKPGFNVEPSVCRKILSASFFTFVLYHLWK
jgi:hypothetical protein